MPFPKVNPGDPFTPSASLSNAVRNLINGTQSLSARINPSNWFGSLRIHVFNLGDSDIGAFTFAAFDNDNSMIFPDKENRLCYAVPVLPSTPAPDDDDPRPCCYACHRIRKGEYGECIVGGTVVVTLEGDENDGDYAAPVCGTSSAMRAKEGYSILYLNGNQALIDLSAYHGDGSGAGSYTGSFAVKYNRESKKLTVGGGFISRNGKIELIGGAGGIKPEDGYLCVTSTLDDESGTWSDPIFEILNEITDGSYPIAEISVISGNLEDDEDDEEQDEDEQDDRVEEKEKVKVKIRQLPVSVAIIIETAPCPLIKTDE